MRFTQWMLLGVSLFLLLGAAVRAEETKQDRKNFWEDPERLTQFLNGMRDGDDFTAYKEGECDLQKARRLAREVNGWTTLTLAVVQNDLPTAKTFLDQGADVNTTDTFNRTLLMLATQYGHDEMARFLVERGAKPQPDTKGIVLQAPSSNSKEADRLVGYPDDSPLLKSYLKTPLLTPRKSRHEIFKSQNYNKESSGTNAIHLDRFMVEVEFIPDRNSSEDKTDKKASGENKGPVTGNRYYYLILKGIPTPILLKRIEVDETGNGAAFEINRKDWIKLEWINEGSLFKISWKNDEGKYGSERTVMVSVDGKRLLPLFDDSFATYGNGGGGFWDQGVQQWEWDPESGEAILSRIVAQRKPRGDLNDSFLWRTRGDDSGELHDSLDLTRTVYRFRLDGTKLRCVSAKRYCLQCNELPLANIAMHYRVLVPELLRLNPGQKDRVFCNGTLYLGETAPFIPTQDNAQVNLPGGDEE